MTITKPSKTNSFTAGTITKSSQVNTNFDDVFDVFEEDAYLAKGWFAIDNASFEYNSANSIKTTSDVDVTGLIQVGDKITFEQATDGEKFFFITAIDYNSTVANRTYIELYGGTDYDVDNEAITADTVGFSRLKAPFGFPLNPDKWTVSYTNSSDQTASFSGSSGTVQQIGSGSITVPAGLWNASYLGCYEASGITNHYLTYSLSESASAQTNIKLVFAMFNRVPSSGEISRTGFRVEELVEYTSSTTLYTVMRKSTSSAFSTAGLRGDLMTTLVKFTIAYL